MLIAQITDLHLGFGPGGPLEDNAKRLDSVIEALNALAPPPDLVLVTGDLSDRGDDESYRLLKWSLGGLPMPVHLAMGNHDDRAAFAAVFPDTPEANGFVQYVIEDLPLRIVVIDTLEVGRHGGGFCEQRAAWLDGQLDQAPDRPTLLVLHHPPFDTGIDWMSIGPDEPWVARLETVVASHPQIVAMICGHVHRPIVSGFAGTIVRVCPSVQPQVALDLKPMDPDRPDDRPMIVAGPPAFALHVWTGKTLVTHFTDTDELSPDRVLARYDAGMQDFIRGLAEERSLG